MSIETTILLPIQEVMVLSMSTDLLKKLWDEWDGVNDTSGGLCGEVIHKELNKRGEGSYCAV